MAWPVAAAQFAVSAYSIYSGRKNARRMRREMKRQRELAEDQLEYAQSRWNEYLDTFGDLRQRLVADAERGVLVDYEALAGEAAADIGQQFDTAQDAQRREMMSFGLDPTSGRYQGMDRQMGLDRARATAYGVNQARRDERNRAEDETYRRRMEVFGRGVQEGTQAAQDVMTASGNLQHVSGQSAEQHGRIADNLFEQAGFYGVYGAASLNDHFGEEPERPGQAPQQAPSNYGQSRDGLAIQNPEPLQFDWQHQQGQGQGNPQSQGYRTNPAHPGTYNNPYFRQ